MKRKLAAWVQWFQPYSLCPRLQNLARPAIVGQLLPNRVKTIYNCCKTHLVTRDPPRLCSSADYYSAFIHTVYYTVLHCVLHSSSHCFIVFNTGWRKILWFSAGKFRFIQKTCVMNTEEKYQVQDNNVINTSTMFQRWYFFPLNNNGIWFHFLFPAEKVSGLVQNFWIHSHRIFVRMNIC